MKGWKQVLKRSTVGKGFLTRIVFGSYTHGTGRRGKGGDGRESRYCYLPLAESAFVLSEGRMNSLIASLRWISVCLLLSRG
jgi:hypothetical protein